MKNFTNAGLCAQVHAHCKCGDYKAGLFCEFCDGIDLKDSLAKNVSDKEEIDNINMRVVEKSLGYYDVIKKYLVKNQSQSHW